MDCAGKKKRKEKKTTYGGGVGLEVGGDGLVEAQLDADQVGPLVGIVVADVAGQLDVRQALDEEAQLRRSVDGRPRRRRRPRRQRRRQNLHHLATNETR